jgi:hypothetical protein
VTRVQPAKHPSYLALDQLALGVAAPDVAAHVAGCAECQARGAAAPLDTVPSWVRALGPRRAPSPFAGVLAALRGWRGLGLGVAAAACFALVWSAGVRPDAGPPADYVGTKGAPSVWVHVKRGDHVDVWTGGTPIKPGDFVRLSVAPDRFAHVSVFAETPPATFVRLYDAALPPGGNSTALPLSWEVDDRPGDETLLVVLGPDAVAASEVAGVLAKGEGGRRWWRRLVFAKAAR